MFLYLQVDLNGVDRPIKTENLMVSFFFAYWVVAFFSYSVSGAHYNPAVSFAFLFKGDAPFNKILFIFYILSQFAGALLGALLSLMLTRSGGNLYIRNGDTGSYKFLFQAIVIEFLGSFLYILIFIIGSDKATRFSQNV